MTKQWQIELSDGGYIQPPDENSGTIRRKDSNGNTEEVRCIGEDDWHEWAELWELTESDFQITGRSLLKALKEIEETSPERLNEPLYATYDKDDEKDIVVIKALLNDCTKKPIVLLDDSQGTNDLFGLLEKTIAELVQFAPNTTEYKRYKEIEQIVAEVKESF